MMEFDFDKTRFEELMNDAVAQHAAGRYEDALALSVRAYEIAPPESPEKGRAARDNSARCDRRGNTRAATRWAFEAYSIHDGILTDMGNQPTREAFRERSVSAMYVGVSGMRRTINALREGVVAGDAADTLRYMRKTWSDLYEARYRADGINRYVDQYEINAARRVSIAESLIGKRSRGLAIGAKAVGLACMSESPLLDTSNPDISVEQRLNAKKKAFVGGLASVAIGLLTLTGTMRARQRAVSLADRIL